MNKNQFMNALENGLKRVSEMERQDILADYEEHFQIAMESGESEEEIAKKLGNPKTIAKETLADYHVTQAKEDKSASNITQAILSTISLGFFNFVFVLGPVMALFGIYLGLISVCLAMVIGPITVFITHLFTGFDAFVHQFFNTLAVTSLGVLCSVAMIYVTKFLYNITIRYIEFNLQIIKGGSK